MALDLDGLGQLHIETQRTHLFHEHVEALRNAGFERVVAANDRLVDLGAARDIVRFNGQHLLQGVCSPVRFERPHLHLAKTLTAELRLAAQRLLGHEAVGTDRSGMDLVVHEVMQLQHVDVADRDLAVEGLAGAPIMQRDLPRRIETGLLQHLHNVVLVRSIEHRSGDRHATLQVLREVDDPFVIEIIDLLVHAVDGVKPVTDRLNLPLLHIGIDGIADLLAKSCASPAEMRLEDLSNVHAARHAERIQNDVDRRSVRQEGHVFLRHDLGHHALVAVATGHLVAGLDLALYCDKDLDHLHHAGRKLIPALQLLDLVEEAALKPLLGFVVLLPHGLNRCPWTAPYPA